MALINNDSSAREDYLMKSKILKSQKEEINNIRIEVSSIKNDMDEIKKLLVQLLGKGTNG
jgi:gluconate kinase